MASALEISKTRKLENSLTRSLVDFKIPMSFITLRHRQSGLIPMRIPLWVLIGGRPVGLMRGKEVKIELPKGVYSLGVRFCVSLGKWQPGVQAEHKVVVGEDEHVVVEFTSRERLWNLLFDIDLMLCLLSFFITLPSPWGTVYDVVSNGFFLLWAIHVWTIRTRFFTFTTH